MKIAYLDPHPTPSSFTESVQILQNVDALGQLGHTISLITPMSKTSAYTILGRDLNTNVILYHLKDFRQSWYYPSRSNKAFYWQAYYWLKANAFDAILVRNLKLAEYLLKKKEPWVIFFETHELFAKVFQEEHSPLSDKNHKRLVILRKREHWVYQHCRGIIGITSSLLEDIQQYYNITTPMVVARSGVNIELAKSALALPKKDNPIPIILYLGSLHPWKGVDTLISAMPDVHHAKLWIVGGNDEQIIALKQLTNNLGVNHKVDFIGSIEPNKRFELIAQADICILPLSDTSIANRYTSPLKLFEYIAMGKIIIVPDIESIREILVNGKHALFFELNNIKMLSELINNVSENLIHYESMKENALTLSEKYTWRTRAKSIADFIQQVL